MNKYDGINYSEWVKHKLKVYNLYNIQMCNIY